MEGSRKHLLKTTLCEGGWDHLDKAYVYRLGTLHPSTWYIWRRVDASPQQGAGTTLSPQFPHARSALARGNTPGRSQTHKHKPQAAPKAESCLW